MLLELLLLVASASIALEAALFSIRGRYIHDSRIFDQNFSDNWHLSKASKDTEIACAYKEIAKDWIIHSLDYKCRALFLTFFIVCVFFISMCSVVYIFVLILPFFTTLFTIILMIPIIIFFIIPFFILIFFEGRLHKHPPGKLARIFYPINDFAQSKLAGLHSAFRISPLEHGERLKKR